MKQALIDLPLAESSFEAFPDAVHFADGLHAAGLRLSWRPRRRMRLPCCAA
jgi:hypothetical protein